MENIIVPTYDLGLIFNAKGDVTFFGTYNVDGFNSAGVKISAVSPYSFSTKSDQNPSNSKGSWVDYGRVPGDEPAGFTDDYEVWCSAVQTSMFANGFT